MKLSEDKLIGWLVMADSQHGEGAYVPEEVNEAWFARGWVDSNGDVTPKGRAVANMNGKAWGVVEEAE